MRFYFDYAATTPVDERVVKAMRPYFAEKFGNTASLHYWGQEAALALGEARVKMVKILGVDYPDEIIFTGSATESNNMVLKGAAFANREKGNHILISAIEHDCVMNSARWLKEQGFEVEKIPVDKEGLVDPSMVEKAIRKETILVSVMHGNNEIGVIEPIEKIGRICREKKVLFHTDAAQTFGKTMIKVNKLPVDLLTASSHKIYGPKGAALLYIRRGTKITPLLHGGGHEFGRRSSTVNVPAIVGFAKAAEIAYKNRRKEGRRLKKMRDVIIDQVLKNIARSFLNGPRNNRLCNNISLGFSGIEGEALTMRLNNKGIAVSTGSACASQSLSEDCFNQALELEPSHVLKAINLPAQKQSSVIRISLGRFTTKKEVDYLLEVLPGVVADLRKISPIK